MKKYFIIIVKEMKIVSQNLQQKYLKNELVDIVGKEYVLDDKSELLFYAVDVMWIPRMYIDRGLEPPLPDFVVLPKTAQEVSKVIKLANQYRIPVVPWGGGSGSQGGIMPIYGGITIDLKRMNSIIAIDEDSQTVTAEGGINQYDLECALNARGYSLPHIPASIHSATLGGSIACRGSGVLSTKYGKIEDMVLQMEIVLPNGDVIDTLPVPNHACGPGIMQLFIGAEGSFGIISKARLQIEKLPEERRFYAYLFKSMHEGFEVGKQLMLKRINPCVIRLYDEPETIKQIKKLLGNDISNGCYIVIGLDGEKDQLELHEKKLLKICEEFDGQALSTKNAWNWWNRRYTFHYPKHNLDFPALFGTMDTICTFENMENLYATKKKVLEEKYAEWNLEYIAHMSHWYPWGVMVYDRFVVENPPQDPDDALALHNEIWNTAVRTSIQCGGVINEHHGVGLKLARFMREQYGSAFQVIEGLKNSLDPHNILNPGKMGFGPTK
jgi:alkyldihydroxyacetonephosphate synthase